LFPTPDNKFELNDLVAFGKMWIWYYHEYQADSVFAFNFDHNDIVISNVKSSTFSFTAIDSNYNSTSFIIADKNSLGPKISFKIKDRSLKTEISNGVEKINVEVLPQKFSLIQNYPNPFNNETTIKYEIPLTSDIVIKIYDIVGREIFSKSFYDQKPGVKHFKWEGHDKKSELVSSGVYFFQISDGENVKRMKMILLK